VVNKHSCSREFKININIINEKWLSKNVEKFLRENPKFKTKDVCEKAVRKWNTNVTFSMARKAKALTLDQVESSFEK